MKSLPNLLVFLIIIALFSCKADISRESLLAEEGLLDLRAYPLDAADGIKLDGQWDFYWNHLLIPEDFKGGKSLPEAESINVPGVWTQDNAHPSWGYGSFRLKIIGLVPKTSYSLYIPEMLTAYRLWINGVELSFNGQTGKNIDESVPQYLPKIVSFETDDEFAEILCQISNFDYRKGGIWRSIRLGSYDNVVRYREMSIILETFLAGILLAISLFHITTYYYRRKEKSELLFGLICLTLFLRLLGTGDQLLTFLLPRFSWEIIIRMEYSPFYLTAPLVLMFISTLFPDESLKIVNRVFLSLWTLLGAFIIIFPVRLTNNIISSAEILLILGIIYVFTILIKAMVRKKYSALSIFTAYTIFSGASINDILYSNQIIYTMYLAPLGFLLFIIIQSQILTRRFTKSIAQRELLKTSRDKFRHASFTDSLTGLFNVRFMQDSIVKEILRTIEDDSSLSVIMADVDDFKNFNDSWGHTVGDEVLKTIARIIRTSARGNDVPCRYGGEEFAVILPGTELTEAAEVAERIRLRFESAEDLDKRMKGVTVSIGVAQFQRGETVDELVERADKALYLAKHNGKNRVELNKQLKGLINDSV